MKHTVLALSITCLLHSGALARSPNPPESVRNLPVAMLFDLGAGQVLYANSPDKKFLPALLAKVMTAYVAFEEIEAGRLDPQRQFTVQEATAKAWHGRGTSMYLTAGQTVSAHDLLRGIMTVSANDAAIVLAKGYAGSLSAWTVLMNDSAQRLGMTNSYFATPSGWPDRGRTYVSARDMVRLSSAMIRQFPDQYRQYSGKLQMQWNRHDLFSHDPVTGVVKGADGIKTGFTREAGYNFLGSAHRDGRRLVIVVAGAGSSDKRSLTSQDFLESGFTNWRQRALFSSNETIAKARVQGGTSPQVDLSAGRSVYAAIPVDSRAKITMKVTYKGPITAPVKSGQKLGYLEIQVGELPAGRIPLYAKQAVERASPIDRIINGFMNLFS